MMDGDIVDAIGNLLFYCIPATPLIFVPLVWRLSNQNKFVRILIGLMIALIASLLLFAIAFGIAFRNGVGPG
jgi:hypothetical protein